MKPLTKFSFLTCSLLFIALKPFAQDYFAAQRQGWLEKAQQSKPLLIERVKHPQALVQLVNDTTAFQGWRPVATKPVDSLYQSYFKNLSRVVVDFGEHLTGYFSFSLKVRRGTADAPLRLKFTFGEVPAEVAVPFDPYSGSLSRAWLQDEVVTVTELPATITISRRVAFRYVKIELLGSSSHYDFSFSNVECKATTSATTTPAPLSSGTSQVIKDIDKVGLVTLKECMQTVYEDGPKRDRRLWIGDLYLEALVNTYSFKNHQLTKRCLYLLAGVSDTNGSLVSNAFETPEPHAEAGAPFLFEYSLLYNVALKDYLIATNDKQTALDLWPVAKKQMDNPKKFLKDDGMFDYMAAKKAGWWLFIDWNRILDREASLQGVIIYSMMHTYELAKLLGKESEVAELPGLIKKMRAAAKRSLYNKETGLYISGPNKQVSYASQAWMVLSGVATKSQARNALKALNNMNDAVRPGAPYLYHYYIEALLQCGLQHEAKEALVNYWGGMLAKGADTFWEVYDPTDDFLSPYRFYLVNSYCHAWSCTPVYFIRRYPEVFQK
jgi:alpha-L-rhamnosidase